MTGLERYRAQLWRTIIRAVDDASRQAMALARELAPLGDGSDGGHLRDCITARVELSAAKARGEVTASNPHAAYVEMGTSRAAAQPYLRPALQQGKAGFEQLLRSK